MNPIHYQNCHVKATPAKLSPEGILGPRFLVEVRFSQDAAPLCLEVVHLSNEAQQLIASGRATGLPIETLELNSLSASLLGNPHLPATAVELDGKEVACTLPPSLQRTWSYGLAIAVDLRAIVDIVEPDWQPCSLR